MYDDNFVEEMKKVAGTQTEKICVLPMPVNPRLM